MTGTVVVIGSINQDIVCEVPALPSPGETVLATRTRRNVGGKGSNQAVAAALAGARVEFVGRIGDDPAAEALSAALTTHGVGVTALRQVADTDSGVAYILVAEDNIITVDPGANAAWRGDAAVEQDHDLLAGAAVVATQLELPLPVVQYAAATATGRFVLNAAPWRDLPEDLLAKADPLVLNEHELAALVGVEVSSLEGAIAAATQVVGRGTPSVVVTLGAAGAVWVDASGHGQVPAPAVTAVDTTGAGDAFVGNLAAGLAAGATLGEAAARAVIAASLSVQSPGTHDSYPTAAAVDSALTRED